MPPLTLFSVFHLNLLFSSIPEEERPQVIKKCYWPLLQLIRNTDAKIAIEATGYTLEEIARIDPEWIREFQTLITEGRTELVGSGYAQVVGPLVPAVVTAAHVAVPPGTPLAGVVRCAFLLNTRPLAGLVFRERP